MRMIQVNGVLFIHMSLHSSSFSCVQWWSAGAHSVCAAKIHPLRDSNTNSSSSLPCKFNSLLIIICKSVEAILLQFSFCYFSEIMDHSSIIALYIRCCFITVFPSYLMSGSSEARTEFFSIWLELQSLIYNHNYQSTVVAITFIYFQC